MLPVLLLTVAAQTLVAPQTPADTAKPAPFAFADFTWLNGTSRQSASVLDTKYVTGEFRLDARYIYDFNGIRIQIFPSDKLKIEPWIVNGWQSYGMFNSAPGLGWQILWRPNGTVSVLSNEYYGHDWLGIPKRWRAHSDNSLQIKYRDHPASPIDKAAFSLTVDVGCESGGGVRCEGNGTGGPAQNFAGFMLYNRLWLGHDVYALTLGG